MIKLVTGALLLFSIQCAALEPTPELSPADVVTFQLKSLQSNDTGEGIAATYRFASPANKAVTGPLPRFARLFEHERYQPMLNHQSAEVELTNNDGSQAELLTRIIDRHGLIHHYRFILSKQSSGNHSNCWMTDAVVWEPKPGRSA